MLDTIQLLTNDGWKTYWLRQFDNSESDYRIDYGRHLLRNRGSTENPDWQPYSPTSLYFLALFLEHDSNTPVMVALVNKGIVGPWRTNYELAEQDYNATLRTQRVGQRYRPKPRQSYRSKAQREADRHSSRGNIGMVLAEQMLRASKRPSFVSRLMGDPLPPSAIVAVEDMTKLAYKNRAAINSAAKVGCYFCLKVSDAVKVVEWADKGETGLCPRCGVDSLLPDVTDENLLRDGLTRWFTGRVPADQEPSREVTTEITG